MKIIIDSVLKKQNKTRFWLSQQTGITYPNICNLCNNKTSSIQFTVLDKICDTLNCNIADILLREENSYSTGEKSGKGKYICDTCGQVIVLDDDTNVLPPCPKCHSTKYH